MADPGDRERQGPEKQGLSGYAEAFRKGERYTGATFSLVASVAVFTLAGNWLDGKVGNRTPWFTLAGAGIGMVGGFISFFKAVLGSKKQ